MRKHVAALEPELASVALIIPFVGCSCRIDMGRLSSKYRELFGETPSTTLALRLARQQANTWL